MTLDHARAAASQHMLMAFSQLGQQCVVVLGIALEGWRMTVDARWNSAHVGVSGKLIVKIGDLALRLVDEGDAHPRTGLQPLGCRRHIRQVDSLHEI